MRRYIVDMDAPAADLAHRLVEAIRPLGRCIVAYSGGVDSAVVAYAAHAALGDGALAITGSSASLASGELDGAIRIAQAIGIQHETLATDELADPQYLRNAPDRCFHCKTELYSKLEQEATRRGIEFILNGANVDDLGDFRPGMKAASQHRVRSPLADCGLDKNAVRALAKHWGIEIWDKPATPCLSSRLAYGVAVSPERLSMIDQAEAALRTLGFGNLRVRLHENDLARLELSLADLARMADAQLRSDVAAELRRIGFRYVTLDLEGFRSGSFQQLVPMEELTRFSQPSRA
ncbi:ATP-dependent sacrificial sulfur transferase LarE [Lacipirellula parvula]|uniref:ATP-utilizing enzyme of the PP-loop superfamily n=1 Tax=Lacipirellula parvula TaxID=2650471 RepID=A0A5K7XBC6_9BACT|nr:ATP-dependent sacrificial sulfur transferase LarE [Lacipirellula parvula]BBO33665.1 ATP-utilizing enzyme of the PP-loop superfamily [Lacipirellula parvula]